MFEKNNPTRASVVQSASAGTTGAVLSLEGGGELPQERGGGFVILAMHAEKVRAMTTRKRPSIEITTFDKERLTRLLGSLAAAPEVHVGLAELEQELERGIEVDSREVGSDVVTMNSTVRITDLETNASHRVTIVFPAEADPEAGRISILSSTGTALLGYRAGDVVTWETSHGTRRIRIDALLYQPEAAGDFHL